GCTQRMRNFCSRTQTDPPAQRISCVFVCIFLLLQREMRGYVLRLSSAATQASTIPKCCWNSSSASLTPLSFTTTDLAVLLGFEIYPFSCNLSKASQSKPFQARQVDVSLNI